MKETNMSVDGIWKVEMLGPYGWESMSTAFLEDGRYLASSQDHYSVGRYELTGNQVKVKTSTHSHGQARTMFGVREPLMELSFEGTLSGDQISGQAEDKKDKYSITFRATRLANLD
jgi:hypothetical protein